MQIALIGYGKMGKAIEEIAVSRGHTIALRIDQDNLDEFTEQNFSNVDVAIEFTSPHSAYDNLKRCIGFGVPVVCGSTGWTDQLEDVKQLAIKNNTGFIYASNFSVGVNLFFELNKKLASIMAGHPEYDVRLTEIHHTQKKDAPSGTAITLAEGVMDSIKGKRKWVNGDAENTDELSITSIREDPAPGTHSVKYTSVIDDIEIIHTAHSREGFATGAVLAAEFIKDRKGFYTMKEVLGL